MVWGLGHTCVDTTQTLVEETAKMICLSSLQPSIPSRTVLNVFYKKAELPLILPKNSGSEATFIPSNPHLGLNPSLQKQRKCKDIVQGVRHLACMWQAQVQHWQHMSDLSKA